MYEEFPFYNTIIINEISKIKITWIRKRRCNHRAVRTLWSTFPTTNNRIKEHNNLIKLPELFFMQKWSQELYPPDIGRERVREPGFGDGYPGPLGGPLQKTPVSGTSFAVSTFVGSFKKNENLVREMMAGHEVPGSTSRPLVIRCSTKLNGFYIIAKGSFGHYIKK